MTIITNGSAAVEAIQLAGIEASFISWDDVLHDGPVPAGLTHEALTETRAAFIASRGWAPDEDVRARLNQRDVKMYDLAGMEVVLWFEHDLYDQLQMLQILDGFNQGFWAAASLSLICHGEYITSHSPEALRMAFEGRKGVSDQELASASEAWIAFRDADPVALQQLANENTFPLSFVPAAFRRLVECFPDERTGLSRVEEGILNDVLEDSLKPGTLFQLYQKREEPRFMGDASFFARMDRLVGGGLLKVDGAYQAPGLTSERELEAFLSQTFSITDRGRLVYQGQHHFSSYFPEDAYWIGGVRLTTESYWYRTTSGRLVEKT